MQLVALWLPSPMVVLYGWSSELPRGFRELGAFKGARYIINIHQAVSTCEYHYAVVNISARL